MVLSNKKQPRRGSKYLPGRSENGTEGGLHLGELFSELGEVVVGEVQVRDEANQVLTKSNGPDAQHFELADVVGGQDRVRELHDDDVRVNGVEVFHLRFLAQHVADGAGSGVVVAEAVYVVVEGVNTRGGQKARLPPAAAHDLAEAPRLLNKRPRTQQQRAHRTTQPLGQANADRVEELAVEGGCFAGFDQGVEKPSPVQVQG